MLKTEPYTHEYSPSPNLTSQDVKEFQVQNATDPCIKDVHRPKKIQFDQVETVSFIPGISAFDSIPECVLSSTFHRTKSVARGILKHSTLLINTHHIDLQSDCECTHHESENSKNPIETKYDLFNDPNGDSPNLPFIIAKLGDTEDLPVNYISLEIWNRIPNKEYYKTGEETLVVTTAKTRDPQVCINATLPMSFQDRDKKRHSLRLKFKITDLLRERANLGCTFLNNKRFVSCMQPTTLNLKHPSSTTPIKIPIFRLSQDSQIALLNSIEVTIPPNDVSIIHTYASNTVLSFGQLVTEELYSHEDDKNDTDFSVIL